MPAITFNLNGKRVTAPYEPGMHFLEVLRQECGVVSAKDGCAPEGTCGCCVVLIDGTPAMSCLRKPEQMNGRDVVTVEGLPETTRRTISEAFVLEGGAQCGFCIPGIVVRAASLIERGQTDDRQAVAKALDGHLCRCTGYGRILDSIQTAGEACRNGGKLPRAEPRRHSYFGEEFGYRRNPAFATDANDKADGIGQSIPRQQGLAQSLGEVPFVDDMRVPGMLHGAMVPAEHPRARVLKIHTLDALAMPGVVRVFTAADVPGNRGTGLNDPDQPVFVAEGELTCCVADFVAIVVADTAFHARQSAAKVHVDYEVLEPITDAFRALEPDAPLVHSDETFAPRSSNVLKPTTAFSRGDVDAALARAAHVLEATFDTQPIDIAFLEPESCLAVPLADGGVKVHTQSQGSVYDHAQIARILNLDPSKVEIALAASGGAFGAKEELSIQGQTAVAALLLQRPVKTTLTRPQSTQHHVKRHAMTVKLTVGADKDGRLTALRSRIVADAGGYHTTSAKCALRAACHSTGVYRIPNVDVEAKAVYTNNPNAGAMRGFGSNQAQFAMEGIMDVLAERVGVDGWDIRDRNILNPGDAFGTGQIMRESVRGIRETLESVKKVYKSAKYKGIGCGIKSTGLGNGTIEGGYIRLRVVAQQSSPRQAQIEILNGYTEMGQGVYTATIQAVCEETGLPAEMMTIRWDKELGEKCGETWASRATTLSCAAAQRAAQLLMADIEQAAGAELKLGATYDAAAYAAALGQLVGREYYGECVYNFTTRPGTPESVLNPTTHLTFSYAAQVVILDEKGRLERVLVANDVGRAINPRLCAEQMEGGVHMGLGYALSENFTSTNGVPDSLALGDMGIVRAKHMPLVDVILVEVPDEVGGYGAKGVGEIGCVATAGAVAGALHSFDRVRRYRLPMDDAEAAKPLQRKLKAKSSKRNVSSK